MYVIYDIIINSIITRRKNYMHLIKTRQFDVKMMNLRTVIGREVKVTDKIFKSKQYLNTLQ